MKKNAIMLADTRTALVGTVLVQLQETNPGLFDEAIIYYDEPISEKDRKVMCEIMPCRFIRYERTLPQSVMTLPRFHRFSRLMFCRYEMFSFLTEFETVAWLDTDILIQGDLRPMLEKAAATGAALIREDPIHKTASEPDRMRTCFTKDLPGFQTDRYLYCSGTIVLSGKIKNGTDIAEWCYEKTVEWAEFLSLPDQGVINAAIQQFQIDVNPLRGDVYCCFPSVGRDCSNAAIVHAWGSNKFWNDWYLRLSFPRWKDHYERWVSIGGMPLPFALQPSVSVLIPTYRPKLDWLKECVDSLMQQNRGDWERFSDFEIIIVAEPVETGGMKSLLTDYHDPRIRLVINESRMGIAASLNRGMRLAKGAYIARIDDDDLSAPSRLYRQKIYLDQHPEITLCTSDFEYFGDMNERRYTFEGEQSRAWSIFTCPFDHPTIMFRRAFFMEHQLFYDESRGYVEDWELWRRAFRKGMRVGCIHDVLSYHRWVQAAGAGQSSKTVEMMREMVQSNFQALEVEISADDLPIIAPWNGRLQNEADIEKLKRYFSQALEGNRKRKIYDTASLEDVFLLRLEEAKTGTLPGLAQPVQCRVTNSFDTARDILPARKSSFLKRFLKRIFKSFYRPFRHRYEDRIINIQNSGWAIEGHVLNCIAKLDRIIAEQQTQIVQMRDELAGTQAALGIMILEQMLGVQRDVSAKLFAEAENTRQELGAKLFTEAENTRQELSAKLFTEAENTRQELSAKLFTEAENTRQELSARLFREGENTRGYTENHLWEIRQTLTKSIDAGFWNLYYEKHKDEIASGKNGSGIYNEIFYLKNRYGSVMSAIVVLGFVLERLPCKSLVDFGCGTGTWLWVALGYGVTGILGVDGDYVPGHMLMIPTGCFQAADLCKGFTVSEKYDMAMSLEVAEHLPIESADILVDSLCKSADVVLFSAAHPGQGGDGHINEQPVEYWVEKFAMNEYRPIEIRHYFAGNENVEWWYRENLVLFVSPGKYQDVKNRFSAV